MTQELKKSLSSILHERTTSPFYGTLIVSWLIWNWKIIYLTLFISEDNIPQNKIDYIVENYNDIHHLLTYPIISTVIILTLAPFLVNGAYWLSISFSNWRVNQRNLIEKKQVLTVEQSIELREQILKQEERFASLVEDKNSEIESLKQIIKDNKSSQDKSSEINQEEIRKLAERFKANSSELAIVNKIIRNIQGNYKMPSDEETIKVLALLESYLIIDKSNSALYKFTPKGKRFLRYLNE